MGKRITKPGRSGTLILFCLTYTCRIDPGFGSATARMWGYDESHVVERFNDADGTDGDWTLLSVAPARTVS